VESFFNPSAGNKTTAYASSPGVGANGGGRMETDSTDRSSSFFSSLILFIRSIRVIRVTLLRSAMSTL